MLDVCVNMIQSVLSPCRTLDMLVELWEYSLQIGLIKVPCNYVDTIGWARCCSFMVFSRTESTVNTGVGWNIHSRDDHNSWQKKKAGILWTCTQRLGNSVYL